MEAAQVKTCRGCGRYWLVSTGGLSIATTAGKFDRTEKKAWVHQCISCRTVSVLRPAEMSQMHLEAFFPAGANPSGNLLESLFPLERGSVTGSKFLERLQRNQLISTRTLGF